MDLKDSRRGGIVGRCGDRAACFISFILFPPLPLGNSKCREGVYPFHVCVQRFDDSLISTFKPLSGQFWSFKTASEMVKEIHPEKRYHMIGG